MAIADLKAIDARLTALAAAKSPIESDGVDLTDKIRESQKLVRAAIVLLSGASASGLSPRDTPDQTPGTKRRVKVKAASETTTAGASARTETPGPSAPASSAASATKPGSRGGARTRIATAAPAPPAKISPGSLLARLGAATAETVARDLDTSGSSASSSPAALDPIDPATLDAAARLARLEAEIDNLTEASITGNRSKPVAADAPPPTSTTKSAEVGTLPAVAVIPAPAKDGRSGESDDEDDAEIVIVTADGTTAGKTGHGTAESRQRPRVFRDAPADEDDAEVQIVQRSVDGRETRLSLTPENARAKSGATKPASPGKWRLFRGSQ